MKLKQLALIAAVSISIFNINAVLADGNGRYTLNTVAGVGESYTGKLDVKGTGKFHVIDNGDNLVFVSQIGACKDLTMADNRQKHTCGSESKLSGMNENSKAEVTIEKAKLIFPEDGDEVHGNVTGKLKFLNKVSTVVVNYTVRESAGRYFITKAIFTFDYTKHVADAKKICLAVVCVKPTVTMTVTEGTVDIIK